LPPERPDIRADLEGRNLMWKYHYNSSDRRPPRSGKLAGSFSGKMAQILGETPQAVNGGKLHPGRRVKYLW